MTISKMYLFGLLLIVAKLAVMKADVDCSKHPPHRDIHNCCELTGVMMENLKEKCGSILEEGNGNEFSGPPNGHHHGHPHGPPGHGRGPPHHHGPHFACFISCVFNETGILVDDELEEDNMNSYLNEIFDDAENVEFVNNKFMICNEKRKEFALNMPDHKHGPANCQTNHGGMLMGCVNMGIFKDCPESAWSDTDECNAVRDHFNQCFNKEIPTAEEEDAEVEEI